MADPVFAPSRSLLKSKLRLSAEVATTSDAVFDEALLQVRSAIYRLLGASRVATINATGYSESATTDAQITRLTAAQVELYGVKARLLRDAPTFLLEAKNSADEAWNDDDLLRNASNDEEAIAYYENLFLEGLESLVTGEEPNKGIEVRTFSPNNTAQKVIGQSITNGKGLAGLWQ
jgi:hypothetical protein